MLPQRCDAISCNCSWRRLNRLKFFDSVDTRRDTTRVVSTNCPSHHSGSTRSSSGYTWSHNVLHTRLSILTPNLKHTLTVTVRTRSCRMINLKVKSTAALMASANFSDSVYYKVTQYMSLNESDRM